MKELLVISQDTSAYGVDVKYRTGFWDGKPVKTRMLELVQALGEIAEPYGAWVRLHYVYPYPSVDDSHSADGNRRRCCRIWTCRFSTAIRTCCAHEAARPVARETSSASSAGATLCPELVVRSTFIAGFPGETEAEFEHLLDFMREARIDRAGCFAYSPVEGAAANEIAGMLPPELREERRARFMAVAEEVSINKLQRTDWCHDASAGGFGAGHGAQGWCRSKLCRCAGNRRRCETAAARKDQQDAEGR